MGLIMLILSIVFIFIKTFILNKGDRDNKIFLLIVGISLIFIFGNRNGVINYGTDLNNYYRMYHNAIISTSFSEYASMYSVEKGYLLLNYGLSRIFKWSQFIVYFQSFICVGLTLRFIYKHSNDILISVLGFMSFGLMQFYLTGFRQGLAIAICLFSIEYAEKKKIVPFLLTIGVATLMHQTSIVFVLAYFLINMKINWFTILLDTLIMFVVIKMVPKLMSIGNNLFDFDYSNTYNGSQGGGLINVFIAMSVLAIVLIFLIKKNQVKKILDLKNTKDEKKSLKFDTINSHFRMTHMLVFGTGFYIMRYQAVIVERIALYFLPSLFIMIPEMIDTAFSKNSRVFLRIIFVLGMLFLIYWRMKIIVYTPFWS